MEGTSAADVARSVAGQLGVAAHSVTDHVGTVTLTVDVASWPAAAQAVRGAGFEVLDWLSAVDGPPPGAPLTVVAMLVRHPAAGTPLARLLLRTRLVDGAIPSLTALFGSAAWHEREAAEMFGVRFTGFAEPTPDGATTEIRPLLTAAWPQPPETPPLLKAATLPARAAVPWPGLAELLEPPDAPADGHRRRATGRRALPPGVPE